MNIWDEQYCPKEKRSLNLSSVITICFLLRLIMILEDFSHDIHLYQEPDVSNELYNSFNSASA